MAGSGRAVWAVWVGLGLWAGCTGDLSRDLTGASPGDSLEDGGGTSNRAAGASNAGQGTGSESGNNTGSSNGNTGAADGDGGGGSNTSSGPNMPDPPPACSESLAKRSLNTDLSSLAGSVAQCGSFAEGGRMPAPHPCARIAAAEDGTLRFAYADGSGTVHVRSIDATGSLFGNELMVDGNDVRGMVAHADGVAMLIARGIKLYLVRLDAEGESVFDVLVEGADDTGVSGARFLDSGLRAGDLDWNGTEYTVYAAIKQNFGSKGTHQGDMLTAFDAKGQRNKNGWDWGCSHSLDLRLAHGMGQLAPICQADVYPKPGLIARNNRQLVATPDLTGGGGSIGSGYASQARAALIGGAVGDGDGVFVSFASDDTEKRASRDIGVLRFTANEVGPKIWLGSLADTQITWAPDLMRFGKNLLVYWETSTVGSGNAADYTGHLMELTPTGEATATTADIASGSEGTGPFALRARDVPAVSIPGGDAAFLTAPTQGALSLVRLRACK